MTNRRTDKRGADCPQPEAQSRAGLTPEQIEFGALVGRRLAECWFEKDQESRRPARNSTTVQQGATPAPGR